MTEEQIKSAISSHFVQLVASRRGFKCVAPTFDHGGDLTVTRASVIERQGRTRYLDSGQYVDVQLKCTCEDQIERTDESIKYDLEAKTYNDLVYRRRSNAIVPLVLVLLVLPNDPETWLTVSADELVVKRAAYGDVFRTRQARGHSWRRAAVGLSAGRPRPLSLWPGLSKTE